MAFQYFNPFLNPIQKKVAFRTSFSNDKCMLYDLQLGRFGHLIVPIML